MTPFAHGLWKHSFRTTTSDVVAIRDVTLSGHLFLSGIGRHERSEQGQDEDDREHGIGSFIIPTNKPAAFGHED